MYAISSYRGNRPTNKQTNKQGRLQYTAPQLSAQCKNVYSKDFPIINLYIYDVFSRKYTVFIVLRAAVRAPVSLAVLLGFTCLVAFVYFVYFYEQINE